MSLGIATALGRVTDAAAAAAAPLVGGGQSIVLDRAALEAMRATFAAVDVDGRIAACEGEKDQAPRFAVGERLGTGRGPRVELAVDPVDGTSAAAAGEPGALAAIGGVVEGQLLSWGRLHYVQKLVVGPSAAGAVDICAPIEETIDVLARAAGKWVSEVVLAVLDRPRNASLSRRAREAGAQVMLLQYADVAASVAAAQEGGAIDALVGIGGAPEALISACAVTCLAGEIQCRPWPRNDTELAALRARGLDAEKALCGADLIGGARAVVFAVSAITESVLFPEGAAGARSTLVLSRDTSGTPPP